MAKTSVALLFVLFIAIMGAFFAFENQDAITVYFGRWSFESSAALFVLSALGLGLILSFIASFPALVSRSLEIRSLKAKIKKIEEELSVTKTAKEVIEKEFEILKKENKKQAEGIQEIEA